MQIREIYDVLNRLSPFDLQSEWDNSGLILGDYNHEIEQIYLSLDIDAALIDTVAENSLIITHHPLIFRGLKKINYALYPSNLIQKMVQKNIALISMHTNFDKTHLNRFVAHDILGYDIVSVDEFICYVHIDKMFDDLCEDLKRALGIKHLRVSGENKLIKTCAITTGSGGDLIANVDADCFLSGDFKYHQALEAKENGLSLIDIGHFESERFFGECLAPHLKNLPLKVIMSNSKNPFDYRYGHKKA
ncbi:Nif3-like dinuclear metal center hexameric protein [Sulfurospirillum sp. 1612]|uniref:Nif3-like dinuclear metal center hexameric protein n=1 Tax=Sulfurospirillum sp. 1612 TaxID=3094835 RepID=UPI002F9246B6